MQCPTCQTEGRKFGKDRKGNQRFQCMGCRKTFSERPAKPLNEMRLPLDKAIVVLKHLADGCSVRATVRLTGIAKGTVLALLLAVGEKCERLMATRFNGLPVNDVQADEIWGFIGMKEKTKGRKRIISDELGDAYCFVAFERDSKLILAWHLGRRDAYDTTLFMENLNQSTSGRFQLSTDGWQAYPQAVEMVFEEPVDYAQIIKQYGKLKDDHKYSPPQVIGVDRVCCQGTPDPNRICTSHVERSNLNMRMNNRRLTRLTNGFSKKWVNHRAALALYFAYYDFCRPHGTLTKDGDGQKTTPAMQAGVSDHPWTVNELLTESAHN